jgi:transcriptional regulator with XRE-family HTH domain
MARPRISQAVKDKRFAIAERLRQYRELARLSRDQVADLCNLKARDIERFETGEKSIPSEHLDYLASAVGVRSSFLLGDN